MSPEESELVDLLIAAIHQTIASRTDRRRTVKDVLSRWHFDLKNAPAPRVTDVICQRILAGGQGELLRNPALKRFLFTADQFSTIKNAAMIAVATYQE